MCRTIDYSFRGLAYITFVNRLRHVPQAGGSCEEARQCAAPTLSSCELLCVDCEIRNSGYAYSFGPSVANFPAFRAGNTLIRGETKLKKLFVVLTALVMVFPPVLGQAAVVTSNVATVGLAMTAAESLSVSATPSNITFTLNGSGTQGTASGPISVTTSWFFNTAPRSVWTVGYFSNPAAALSTRTVNIPSNEVSANINSGRTGFSPCNLTEANVPASGSGGSCPDIATISATTAQGNETDSILLQVDLPSAVAPGAYNGVLNIVAQSN
jgi:hypothetical protein